MRKIMMGAALLSFLCGAARAGSPVIVPDNWLVRRDPAAAQFLGVYAAYAQAVRDRGTQGLKEVAAPDFALSSQGRRLTGEQAFKELSPYLDGLRGKPFKVSFHLLALNGYGAVLLTQETSETQVSKETMTLTWQWKQTWRKTASGWKLAVTQRDRRDLGTLEGTTFTVTPPAQDPAPPSKVK